MEKRKVPFWNLIDRQKGDKVVWIILILLMLASVVTIFSSTSQMARNGMTRIDILFEQLKTLVMGLGAVLLCYLVKDIKWFRWLGKYSFVISICLLAFLDLHLNLGFIKAAPINGAYRVIKVGSLQFHVFEAIKVLMVLYLAWAIDTFKSGGFPFLLKHEGSAIWGWMAHPIVQKFLCIYLPMALVFCLVLPGSGSAALFIALLMFVTILLGGLSIKELILPGIIGIALVAGVLVLNHNIDFKLIKRQATWESRISGGQDELETLNTAKPYSAEWYDAIDDIKQPYAAKIAVKEGGLFGKGPGKSTQRYKVPIMYEDYMFCFILEEYGLFGGIIIMALYLSLIARGIIIVRNCDDGFGKIAVCGLVVLISGQAFMHIMVNVDIGPLTGQTLPIISHGTSALLTFCFAFGVILSISRIAALKIEKEQKDAGSLMEEQAADPVKSSLGDLDDMESNIM